MNIDEVKSKIVKLSKMTVENGCSENEAMFAAKKIAEILDANGMTEAEIKSFSDVNSVNKMEKDGYGTKKKLHEVQYCASAIANFFDCKVWFSHGSSARIVFFGFPQDVAAAIALTETIVSAMEGDFKAYMATNTQSVHGKTLRKSFMLGFALRIAKRLNEYKVERKALNVQTGTALVVLKDQVVESEYKNLNLKLRNVSVNYSCSNGSAFAAGQAAGSKVNLGNKNQIA